MRGALVLLAALATAAEVELAADGTALSLDDDRSPAEPELEAWARARGIRLSGVTVARGPHGRGLFATRDLAPGEAVVHVPGGLQPAFFPPEAAGDPLAVMLALARERARGDDSPWAPFLAAMPSAAEAARERPAAADPALVDRILPPQEAPMTRDVVNTHVARLRGHLADLRRLAPEMPEEDLWWAVLQKAARSNDVPRRGLVFYPIVDMANHACSARPLAVGADGSATVLVGAAGVKAGEEVFVNYSPPQRRPGSPAFAELGPSPVDCGHSLGMHGVVAADGCWCLSVSVEALGESACVALDAEALPGALPAEQVRAAVLAEYGDMRASIADDEAQLRLAGTPVERLLWTLRVREKQAAAHTLALCGGAHALNF